jgi:hypothetical protein
LGCWKPFKHLGLSYALPRLMADQQIPSLLTKCNCQ